MRFLPLIWGNLMRKKLRTAFTLLSILVAFLLYGYLAAINIAFQMGVDVAGADRLITIDKVSIIQLLPGKLPGPHSGGGGSGAGGARHLVWWSLSEGLQLLCPNAGGAKALSGHVPGVPAS